LCECNKTLLSVYCDADITATGVIDTGANDVDVFDVIGTGCKPGAPDT